MTASARPPRSPAFLGRFPVRRGATLGAAILCGLGAAAPAWAGFGGSVSVATDDRYRGHSLSQGRPVASLALTYDAANGLYGGAQATVVDAAHAGPRFLGALGYAGYARRLADGTSLDLGVSHAEYTEYYRGEGHASYTEGYVGLITRRFATHVFYSPSYFGTGLGSVYAEVDSALHPTPGWRVTGHVGVLALVSGSVPGYYHSTQYDWRLGVGRALGDFDLQLAWTGAGPDPDYYGDGAHGRQAVVFAVSRPF